MATLIGMLPSKTGDPALTPNGGRFSSADRLRTFLGLTVDEFLRLYPKRYNLLDEPPWNVGRARKRAAQLRLRLTGHVYVLGNGAWKALGFPERPFFTHITTERAKWTLIPHPSGRSLFYNDPYARKRLRRAVK